MLKKVFKESNISVCVKIILFIYFPIKKFNLWNKMKYTLLRQSTHVFNRYFYHCVTNILQCIIIMMYHVQWLYLDGKDMRRQCQMTTLWNRKKLKYIIRTRKFDLKLGDLIFCINWASYCSYFVLIFLL